MPKRIIRVVMLIGVALIVAMLVRPRQHPAAPARAVSVVRKISEQGTTGMEETLSGHPAEENTPVDRIVALAIERKSPAEIATLLRKLYAENPDGLFQALLSIGQASLETRRIVLPLLADALVLWPEAEGRYVFPLADAYAAMDLPAAAEWGAAFLVKTGRSDTVVSGLLGSLAHVSEDRALSLIASLPGEARSDALNSVAYHIQIGDLNHLMQVCSNLDERGISTFSKQLFDRLGMERLDETAAWLLATPGAARIPDAVASISQALVINHGPQKAISWANSLPDVNVEAQAITAIYREWAKQSPESAIKDILSAYDGGAPQLMADVFLGAAEHHGTGAATHWDAACHLDNSSARAYAISALIESMLITVGPAETRVKITALPQGSLERNAAELMIQAAYKSPATLRQIESRFGKIE